jgi:hypothetical protein
MCVGLLWICLFEHSSSQGLRKSFVIQHDPNPLFDVLGYLLAPAIYDDIFARGVEGHRTRVSHRNSAAYERRQVKSEMNRVGTANLRLARSVNEISGVDGDGAPGILQQAKVLGIRERLPS